MRPEVSSEAEAQQGPTSALAELPLEHLEHELCELASHIEAGMARWLSLVAEYDRRDGWLAPPARPASSR